jgi:predicted transcriptional regulator
MEQLPLPEEIRRFVLTSIPSVPFLEALLLLRAEPAQQWQTDTLARRLYIRDKTAQALLDNLCTAGMAARCDAPQQDRYQYRPSSEALRARIDQLAELYGRHLVEVTLLIHSSLDRKAQQFADAFKWRKDT